MLTRFNVNYAEHSLNEHKGRFLSKANKNGIKYVLIAIKWKCCIDAWVYETETNQTTTHRFNNYLWLLCPNNNCFLRGAIDVWWRHLFKLCVVYHSAASTFCILPPVCYTHVRLIVQFTHRRPFKRLTNWRKWTRSTNSQDSDVRTRVAHAVTDRQRPVPIRHHV